MLGDRVVERDPAPRPVISANGWSLALSGDGAEDGVLGKGYLPFHVALADHRLQITHAAAGEQELAQGGADGLSARTVDALQPRLGEAVLLGPAHVDFPPSSCHLRPPTKASCTRP
jgi:hypothetical protein